jgi:hypothetical protein
MFYLRIIDSKKEIDKINDNINKSLSILYKNYQFKKKDDDEKKIIKPAKHYLNCNNGIDILLNNKDNMGLDIKNNYIILLV